VVRCRQCDELAAECAAKDATIHHLSHQLRRLRTCLDAIEDLGEDDDETKRTHAVFVSFASCRHAHYCSFKNKQATTCK
jgi:hypothetical protein